MYYHVCISGCHNKVCSVYTISFAFSLCPIFTLILPRCLFNFKIILNIEHKYFLQFMHARTVTADLLHLNVVCFSLQSDNEANRYFN